MGNTGGEISESLIGLTYRDWPHHQKSKLSSPTLFTSGFLSIMSQTHQPRNPQHQTSTQTSQNLSLPGTLRLRGEDAPSVSPEPSSSRRIRWSEDVVDNEGMGKKSSKGESYSVLLAYP
jgi:hypothetical protein